MIRTTFLLFTAALLCAACSSSPTPGDDSEVSTIDVGGDVAQIDVSEGDAGVDIDADDEPDAVEPPVPVPQHTTPAVTSGQGSSDSYQVRFAITQPVRMVGGEGETIQVTPPPINAGAASEDSE